MATLEELVVQLTAETSGLRAELNKSVKATQSATSKMEEAIKSFSDNSSKNVGFFETALATMAGFLGSQAVLGAVGKVKDAFYFLRDELKEGAKDAIAEEQAMIRLANSLAISGKYTESAMRGLQDFAGEMENVTGVADDAIASNLALLSSLTRLDAEGLKAAQKAALDFSAATGKDLESATQMVAKAVNGSTDAFKKMGISIAETNDKGTNLNNVVTALNGQFGGAAAGAMKTFQGAMTGAGNAYSNFVESIATAITQNPVVIAGLNEIASIFTELTTASNSAGESLQTGIASVLLEIIQIAGVMASTLDTLFRGLTATIQGLVLGLNAIAGSILYMADLVGAIDDDDPFANLKKTAAALDDTINGSSALSTLSDGLARVHGAGTLAFDSIGKGADVVKPKVDKVGDSVDRVASSFTTMYQEQLKSFAEGLAQQNMLMSQQFEFEQQQLLMNLELKQITQDQFNALSLETMTAQHEAELAQLDAYYAGRGEKDEEYQAARANLLAQQKLSDSKFQADKTKMEVEQNKLRQTNFSDTMGVIAQLSKSGNRELAAIGKAAAVTQATIDGYAAVQKALASAPPPFNFALAAAVGVVTAMNVSKIAGVGIGLNKGGTVPGGGANRDSVPASLTPGEEVVNRSTSEKLRDFLDGAGAGGGAMNITVSFAGATIIGDVRSSEFGAMVVEAINDAIDAGKSLGIRQGERA